jgi:hypothetical protein
VRKTCTEFRRVSQRFATPPFSTREVVSLMLEKRCQVNLESFSLVCQFGGASLS